MRNAAIGIVLTFFVLLTGWFAWSQYTKEPLPEHIIASDKRIGLADSTTRRIEVHVRSDITKEQCVSLLKAYASKSRGGQVSVRKPHPRDGVMDPACVYNQEGDPIIFNDALFAQ